MSGRKNSRITDAPARAHHPAQLGEPARQVAQVAHAEGGERAVEGRVAIGQVVPVGGVGGDARRRRAGQLAAPGAQHLAREVGRGHARPRRAPRDLQRAVERARAQIEHARRLAQPVEQPPDRLLAPDHVDAARHDPVGGVVAARDAVEHPLHVRAPLGQARRRAHSPSSFKSASTRASTAASILRTSGHSRVNPSSFHLRVASTPSLPPKPNAHEA